MKLIIICLPMLIQGQTTPVESEQFTTEHYHQTINSLNELFEAGLRLDGDTLHMSYYLRNLINDNDYREKMYPETYTWEQVIEFLDRQELKKAFWFLINIYSENEYDRELVMRAIMAYDQLLEMDEIIMNTFYTYAFIDPIVCAINDGIPEIIRPDILEIKLHKVHEMIAHIIHFREQQE